MFASLVAVASGCAIQDGARTGLRALDNSQGLIGFQTKDGNAVAARRVIYASTIEREEYALFKSPENQAEFIYITTRHLHLTNLVINRPFGLDAVISGFRHNQREKPNLNDAFVLRSNGIQYWAKAFQLPNVGNTCAAISGSWDAPADHLSPSKALFGYFCNSGTTPLSQQQIRGTMDHIAIHGITSDLIAGNIEFPKLTDAPSQAELLARAQGEPGGTTGNPGFPYNSVRHFERGNNCLFIPGC